MSLAYKFQKAREWATPTLKESAFLSRGVLTPEEFVRAGTLESLLRWYFIQALCIYDFARVFLRMYAYACVIELKGDELVYKCPTWSWESGDRKKMKDYLPADKQVSVLFQQNFEE